MEDQKKKCSFKEHKDINAISYCQECKKYFCNKGLNYHQGLFEKHHSFNLDNNKEIFLNICKEINHPNKLEFYCKDHNKLCCACCITKIAVNEYGLHKDCNICTIKEIKEEKKNKLKDNINYLEELSKNLNDKIKEIKNLFGKIEEKKEEQKLKIQNIFTKIRNAINERENEMLQEIDNKYNEIFGNENIIKDYEKLPNKINISLEKGKLIDNDWNDDNKLCSLINNCITIEDNIKNINIINESIKRCQKNHDMNIEFNLEHEHLENFVNEINKLGKINDKYKIDSLILKNENDIKKFYNLLSNKIKVNNMKLIYSSNKDGLELNNLKNKINKKEKLIFLFLSGNDRIFGSFINAKIEVNHDAYTNDNDAFVFCLNNNKIYNILIPQYAIRFFKGYPILIGNNAQSNGFWICNNTINDNGLLNNPKVYDFQKKNELTEGNSKFNNFEIFECYID